MVEEVERRRIELIVYAAFFCGFMAKAEQRTPDSKFNFQEIHKLIDLITNKNEDKKHKNVANS